MLDFRIKFCGVTRTQDLIAAIDAGADAIGLNFVPSSPRCITIDLAEQLSAEAKARVKLVGVFVNPDSSYLQSVLDKCSLDYIQLHGEEMPERWDEMVNAIEPSKRPPLIRSLAWQGNESAPSAHRWIRKDLAGFLVDAHDPVNRGGTGKLARWDLLYPRPSPLDQVPLILAGGLTPENVAEGIRATQAAAVDTASGVETAPGIKCPDRMRRFVEAVRTAGISSQ